MITVRFPNGQAVQYNNASFCQRSQEYSDLYTKKDGQWIAQVPNICIIEVVPACLVYNPLSKFPDKQMEELIKEVKALRRKLPAK